MLKAKPVKNCVGCEKPFTPNAVNQKYCSIDCRDKQYRYRYNKPYSEGLCQYCSSVYRPVTKGQKYCSISCRTLSLNHHRRLKPVYTTYMCKVCDNEFIAAKKQNAKYCSDECRHRRNNIEKKKSESPSGLPVSKKCKHCGKQFQTVYPKRVKYCNEKCRNIFYATKYRKKYEVRLCKICNTEFIPPKQKQIYCTDKCLKRYLVSEYTDKKKNLSTIASQLGVSSSSILCWLTRLDIPRNLRKTFCQYGEMDERYFRHIEKRAKKSSLKFDITPEYIWRLFLKQNRKCALTGDTLIFAKQYTATGGREQTASLDRIDSSKGYTRDNIQWLHKTINIFKTGLQESEFIHLCRMVVEHIDSKGAEYGSNK